jgi:hypothetical protein
MMYAGRLGRTHSLPTIGKTPDGTLLGGRTFTKTPLLPIGSRGGFRHRCQPVSNASLKTVYTR